MLVLGLHGGSKRDDEDIKHRRVAVIYIPDFSNWKDHNSFEAAFAKLLRERKTSEA